MSRNRKSSGQRTGEEHDSVALDYDFPLEKPTAKEFAASMRENHLVYNLKARPEPVIEIFRDQLVPFQSKKEFSLVCVIEKAKMYRFYAIPFKEVVNLLSWVRMTDEKRPRWRLNLVPKTHQLVARNGSRVERVNIEPYYNKV